MSEDYRSFIDDFDPRTGASAPDGGEDGDYVPRHGRRRITCSGEYRSRRPASTESAHPSPSPVSEGGEDDFDVFNFELARKRKKEREDRLNAANERREAPRRLVEDMAARQPRQRSERPSPERDDGASRRASDFVGRLSRYALTEEAPLPSARRRDEAQGYSSRRSGGSGKNAPFTRSGTSSPDRSASRSTQREPFTRDGASSAPREKSTAAAWGQDLLRRGLSGRTSSAPQSEKSAEVPKQGRGYISSLPLPIRWGIRVCLVLLALLVVYYAAVGAVLGGMEHISLGHRRNTPAQEVSSVKMSSGAGVTNILLLGIDDDGGSGSRSDTIMIASIDTRSGSIRLCSILRDCYVEIPDHKSSRINSAYAYGGAQLAVQTVENNFRIKIDHCATIDMAALVDVVDAMGGVEIELTAAEAKQVNLHSHCGKTTSEGLQLLNGKQAVTYAQIRKIDSDFKRTQRQRTLINAILSKAKQTGPLGLVRMAKAVAPNVATDMSSAQIATLALKALPALSGELQQMTIPADGKYKSTTVNGMSVLKLDLEANALLLREYLYGE